MWLAQDPGAPARAPHDDFWYYPVGTLSAAGARVSPQTALAVSTVYACAQVLAQTVAQVPLKLYRRLKSGGKEEATDHPYYALLHHRPNRWQTSYQWRQMMQWQLALRGNAYSEIQHNRAGLAEQLIPLHPDNVKVERITGGSFRYRVKDNAGGARTLGLGEILHVRGLTANGIEGMSPLDIERESVGEALAAQEYSARLLANDSRPPGVIEWAGAFKDDDDAKKFRASWQAAQTGVNRGRTAVLQKGMTFKPIEIKNTDLQFIELRKLKDNDIARIYRMPPHKVGILDRSTNNNIEHQGIEFLTDTMLPWYVNWEQQLSFALLTDDEDEYFFEFLVDGLLRGDFKTRMEGWSKAVGGPFMLRNEARVRENLNPLDGFDEPLAPLNMGGGQGREQSAGDDNTPAARIAGAAAERVLRKEVSAMERAYEAGRADPNRFAEEVTSFYAAHVDFAGRAMGMTPAAAQKYCNAQRDEILSAADQEIEGAWLARVPNVIASWLPSRARELALTALNAKGE